MVLAAVPFLPVKPVTEPSIEYFFLLVTGNHFAIGMRRSATAPPKPLNAFSHLVESGFGGSVYSMDFDAGCKLFRFY